MPPCIISSRTRGLYERPPESAFVLNEASDQAQGLVAFWPLSVGKGRYLDFSKKQLYPLTMNGAVGRKPVQDGDFAYSNTGSTSNFLEIASTSVASGAPLTYSCWFNPVSASVAYNLVVCCKSDDGGGGNYYSMVATNSTAGRIAAATADGSGESFAESSAGYSAGVPGHGVAVFASATSRAAYCNGGNVGTNATSRTGAGMNRTNVAMQRNNLGSFAPLNGSIWWACIWNIAQTAGMVARLYDPKSRYELAYFLGRWSISFATTAMTSGVSGWEGEFPARTRGSKAAIIGDYRDILLALAQPVAPGSGFEFNAPSRMPRAKGAPFDFNADAFQLSPAATAAVTLGFPAFYLDRMQKGKWVPGAEAWPLNQPPASVAQNPVGWEALFPWKLPKRPTDFGVCFWSLDQPPAATAQNPVGWEGQFPWWLRKKPTDFGATSYPQYPPPASTATYPVGWEAISPWKLRKAPTDPGLIDGPLVQPPASTATNPIGWRIETPDKLRKGPTDRGTTLDPWNLPPPTPTLIPLGFFPFAPEKMRKAPTDPGGFVQTLTALAQPIAPNGWETSAPWKLRKEPTDPGVSDWPTNQPPAATSAYPVGWEVLQPSARKRHVDRGFVDAPVPAQAAGYASGWEAFDTVVWRRRWSPAIHVETIIVPMVLIGGGTPIFRSGILRGRIIGKGTVV